MLTLIFHTNIFPEEKHKWASKIKFKTSHKCNFNYRQYCISLYALCMRRSPLLHTLFRSKIFKNLFSPRNIQFYVNFLTKKLQNENKNFF